MLDYKKIGLKVGLELHQQLDTEHKLFCNCSTRMEERDPVFIVKRKLFPVVSELGELDPAARFEHLRDRTFFYEVFKNEVCAVELDEEPPHELNEEALKIAIEIALLLNCKLVDEVHVMRKTVIDGSNTSGFQRTAIIGFDGFVDYKGKKIKIEQVCLEEDACALDKEENGKVYFKLNRLGIPLVEISTGILSGFTPKEVEEIALKVGMILRLTRKVKRGIGTIRQDVNISIERGGRVEIKGVQKLNLISKVIDFEVKRQLNLLKIIREVERRRGRVEDKIYNLSEFFHGTKCRVLQRILEKNGKIFGFKLSKFSGLLRKELHEGKTFGREIAEYAKAFGVEGIIHTDEDLKKYGIEEEMKKVREFLDADEEDVIVLVGETRTLGRASKFIVKKLRRMFERGLEGETRISNPDGSTRFARPLPGAARMYPETDVPPVRISKSLIKEINSQLPESLEEKRRKLLGLGLSEELINQLLKSEFLGDFEFVVERFNVPPKVVATTFLSTFKDLKRKGFDLEKIEPKKVYKIFELLEKRKIVKEAIPEILEHLARNLDARVEKLVEDLGLVRLSKKKVEEVVKEVLERHKGLPKNKIFGIVMRRVRGRAEIEEVKEVFEDLYSTLERYSRR